MLIPRINGVDEEKKSKFLETVSFPIIRGWYQRPLVAVKLNILCHQNLFFSSSKVRQEPERIICQVRHSKP
jgi:hypothetical protein